MRIIFAGTPDFAATSLLSLIQSEHQVVAVYTQPDRPKGRGRKLQASAVKQMAMEHGIEVCQPINFKSDDDVAQLGSYQADVMVVVAYGLLLPQVILDLPHYGCLNVHASLLPRWRGSAPIQRAIEAGDSQTGVTIMQMEAGLDTGPMLAKGHIDIALDDSAASLHDKLADQGAQLLIDTLVNVPENRRGEVQDEALACYAHKLSKQEATLDFNDSTQRIYDKVRAFNPYPIAVVSHHGEKIRVWAASIENIKDSTFASAFNIGQVCAIDKKQLWVKTVDGIIALTQLQKPGGKPLAIHEFCQGYVMNVGDSLMSGELKGDV